MRPSDWSTLEQEIGKSRKWKTPADLTDVDSNTVLANGFLSAAQVCPANGLTPSASQKCIDEVLNLATAAADATGEVSHCVHTHLGHHTPTCPT